MLADTVTLTVQEALERLHRTHREEGLTEEALEAYHFMGKTRWERMEL
jgi:hypothetical protein